MNKMSKGVKDVSDLAVVCPIVMGNKKYNRCDYPQLRDELSPRMKKLCACAGEEGKECVLRHIRVGEITLVQRVSFHEAFKARGDKDPTEEIRHAIRAHEKQRTLVSRVTRLIKSILKDGVFSFNVKFHRSMRRVLP